MRKVTRAALVLAGSAALIGVTTVPSFAATEGTTTTTVAVTGGGLAITVPETTPLTGAAPGATSSTLLGDTVVTDTRAGTDNWTATVNLPELTATVGTATETIPTTGATYVASVGTQTGTPTMATIATVTNLVTGGTSQGTTAVSGNNSATWPATLTVPIPDQALAATYTGTLTQSVS